MNQEAHTFSRGWFIISASNDLAIGEVKPLRYFAKELVLFRGEDGQAVVLDAYCPHLGAHLGYGGTVIKNTIRCPFHAWQFDGCGRCTCIPYANKIPDRAKTQAYPIKECNGVILIWFDPDNNEPDFDIPVLPEYGHEDWFTWQLEKIEVKTNPREVLENVADVAHFSVVHGMKGVTFFENIYDGYTATQNMRGEGELGSMQSSATYYGPGYQITQMKAVFESRLLNANTPVDENTLHLWFGVMIKKETMPEEIRQLMSAFLGAELPEKMDNDAAEKIAALYCERTRQGYYQDVQIWEHKIYREAPVLCDGDGPIHKLRKWHNQFFLPKPVCR